jgi:hypothetical protein
MTDLLTFLEENTANDNVMQIRYEDFFANDNGGSSPS